MDLSHLFSECLEGTEEKLRAVKEILQEVALCGLSRAGFFDKAALCGAAALRIFHGLDRLTEELEFSLETPIKEFSFAGCLPTIGNEARSYGLRLEAAGRVLRFHLDDRAEALEMRLDTDFWRLATFERKYRLFPLSPYAVRLCDKPSLFAENIHALICLGARGRDLYDYVFLLTQKTPVNMSHLRERLARSGCEIPASVSGLDYVKELLRERFARIDYEEAKADVQPLLDDRRKTDLWSAGFFREITGYLVEAKREG